MHSAYKLASDECSNPSEVSTSSRPDGTREAWKFIWQSSVPLKVQSFAWRLATDPLANWTNKVKRNLEVSHTCPVCGREEEDSFHVLCTCNHAAFLWKAMAKEWTLPDRLSIVHVGRDWFLHLLSKLHEEVRARIMMLFWRIWYVCNKIMHAKQPPPMDVSVRFLSSYLSSLNSIHICSSDALVKGKMSAACLQIPDQDIYRVDEVGGSWSAPAVGRVKLNTDASVLGSTAGAGMIVRDHEGEIVFSACIFLYTCDDVLEAELLAIREGISLALQRSILPIDVESDCLEAVNMIKTGNSNKSKYAFIIREIINSLGEIILALLIFVAAVRENRLFATSNTGLRKTATLKIGFAKIPSSSCAR